MEIYKELSFMEGYDMWLLIIGVAILIVTTLPRILSKYPFSMSIVLLALGYLAVVLPLGLEAPHPLEDGKITEHLTELGVIMALMGAGLKIDRPFSLKGWGSTWRLLAITMPLSIILAAFIGFWVVAFVPATALLLGAVIAPTDPVLASEVQISSPGANGERLSSPGNKSLNLEKEDELRFSLTSEAGLNDGLAFPFTYMALAMVMAGNNPSNWFADWFIIDVLYKISVGSVAGVGIGYLLAKVLFSIPSKTVFAKAMAGMGALASTLILFGFTEYFGGYGFIAVFFGALTIRDNERKHDYNESLHLFSEKVERILLGVILVGFGAAIAGGLLKPLTPTLIIGALLIVFVVRPLAGVTAFIGYSQISWRERFAISFFGIRGIGSMYYLSYALNKHDFPGAEELWALVALVIVISIIVHGILASPVTTYLDNVRNS